MTVTNLNEKSTDAEFTELLMGRRIVRADFDPEEWARGGELELDDGRVLKIEPNGGGCVCGAGDYFLDSIATTDNVITRAELVTEDRGYSEDADGDYDEYGRTFRLYVYADNVMLNAMTISGDDGNGYYGTGFEITVKRPQDG